MKFQKIQPKNQTEDNLLLKDIDIGTDIDIRRIIKLMNISWTGIFGNSSDPQ